MDPALDENGAGFQRPPGYRWWRSSFTNLQVCKLMMVSRCEFQTMRNRACWTCLCVGLAFSLGLTGARKSLANIAGSPRNIARVKTGIFEYRDSDHGKQVGSSTMTIQRLAGSGNLRFIDKADFAEGFSGFHSQRWEAVTSPEFRPILAKLGFLRGDEVVPVFELRYDSGKRRRRGCPCLVSNRTPAGVRIAKMALSHQRWGAREAETAKSISSSPCNFPVSTCSRSEAEGACSRSPGGTGRGAEIEGS
jgi:hypothetical protein